MEAAGNNSTYQRRESATVDKSKRLDFQELPVLWVQFDPDL
jgi:hypothetical protein